MKEEIRRMIVFEAASRVNRRRPSSVYSYDEGRHAAMGAGYDYEAGAHFAGSGSSLYHYGTSSHLNLIVNGKNFSGYDYGDGHHFSGSVSGRSVQIYDYGEGRYFTYAV
jgi:hypothetical protein